MEPIDPIELFNQLTPPSRLSKDDFYNEAPKLRYSHEALGKILLMPQTGLVVVPYEQGKGGWYATVVRGDETYPVGGHNLFISKIEIESALEYSLGELLPATPRIEPDENSIFGKLWKK
jgi:hypothetical protein